MRLGAAALALAGCAGAMAGDDELGRNGQLFVVTLDGERTRLTHDDRFYSSPSWSPDGSRLAASSTDPESGTIDVVDVASRDRRTVVRGGASVTSGVAWSPVGGLVGFALQTEEAVAVGVVRPNGSGRRTLARFRTARTGNPAGPAWSPDGRSLAYSRLRRNGGLRVLDVRTGAERRGAGGLVFDPRWSPDGASILYRRSMDGGGLGLFIVPSAGGAPRPLGPSLISAVPEWSPDGRTVAFSGVTFTGDRRNHLHFVDVGGRTVRAVEGEVASTRPVWSPDGRLVAVSDYEGRVLVMHPDGGGRRTLTQIEGAEIRDLAWSADGRRLAFVARVVPSD